MVPYRQNIEPHTSAPHNIPVTRENYLDLAYMGEPPEELSAEEEANLPPMLRKVKY